MLGCWITRGLMAADDEHSPRLVADLDLLNHFLRRHVDDRDVVRRSVGREEQFFIGRKSDTPWTVANFEGSLNIAAGGAENTVSVGEHVLDVHYLGLFHLLAANLGYGGDIHLFRRQQHARHHRKGENQLFHIRTGYQTWRRHSCLQGRDSSRPARCVIALRKARCVVLESYFPTGHISATCPICATVSVPDAI